MIIAGEASGDLHGANLVKEIGKRDPSIAFYGVGSRRMRDAGVNLLADAALISVVGITEVLTHIGAIYRVLSTLRKFLSAERPDLVVLIDFPDFNIMVGKAAKKLGVPVLYYISPQVWAWRKGRIRTIADIVKAMIVVFPFEVELYRRAGVDVRFVGHPLTDIVQSAYTQAEAKQQFGLDPERRVVAILPGSRKGEIAHLLSDMLGAARILKQRFPELQFILPVAPTLRPEFIRSYAGACGVTVHLAEGRVYDVLRAADAAMVASGTATLEAGLMTVPMAVVYRVSRLSAALGRLFVDAKDIGLVNIVAGRRIVPELIQEAVTPENIAAALSAYLADPDLRRRTREALAVVRSQLGESGASVRAAGAVLEVMQRAKGREQRA